MATLSKKMFASFAAVLRYFALLTICVRSIRRHRHVKAAQKRDAVRTYDSTAMLLFFVVRSIDLSVRSRGQLYSGSGIMRFAWPRAGIKADNAQAPVNGSSERKWEAGAEWCQIGVMHLLTQ